MVKAINIHVFMFLIIKKILKFAGSCWLKETSNTHGKDLLIDGRAPRHGEIMKMPKLAQTFKVFKKLIQFLVCSKNHEHIRSLAKFQVN